MGWGVVGWWGLPSFCFLLVLLPPPPTHLPPPRSQIELMNGPTLLAALDLTHRLDRSFGFAPKMTLSLRDVPGLTRSALPLLAVSGVRALSLGLNSGAPPAEVPLNAPFLWVDRGSGARALTTLHPGGYSGAPVDSKRECITAPGFEHAMCCAWRNDNAGPHSVGEVLAIYETVGAYWPGASVSDSNLDAFTSRLLDQVDRGAVELPEFDKEVGDVWAYGAASDAAKLAETRALMRARALMDKKNAEVQNFTRFLVKLPEHTWSADIKVALNDTDNWGNAAFHARLAANDTRYANTVSTWALQRAYVDRAVEALRDTPSAGVARDELKAVRDGAAGPPDVSGLVEVKNRTPAALTFGGGDGWEVAVDAATGALAGAGSRAAAGGARTQWARGAADPLALAIYSTYDETDYDAFLKRYLYVPRSAADAWWITADLGKAGVSTATPPPTRADHRPTLTGVWVDPKAAGVRVVTRAAFPEAAVRLAGAPAEIWLDARAKPGAGQKLFLDVTWVNKTATRLPEALWLRFAPARAAVDPASWSLYKLHSPVSPLDVVRNGSQSMHGVSHEGVAVSGADGATEFAVGSLDAALVSPGAPTPFPALDPLPQQSLTDHGVSYCLANNVWGTNYIQWQPYGGAGGGGGAQTGKTVRFRFRLTADSPAARRAPGASPAAGAVAAATQAAAGAVGAYFGRRPEPRAVAAPGSIAPLAPAVARLYRALDGRDAGGDAGAQAGVEEDEGAGSDVDGGAFADADAATSGGGFAAPRGSSRLPPGVVSFTSAGSGPRDEEAPLAPVPRTGGRAP